MESLSSIVEEVVKNISKKVTPLVILLVGSRGKGLYSDDSDYDFIVIVQNNLEDYLLQNIKMSPIKISDMPNNTEGFMIDVLSAIRMVHSSDIIARDIACSKIVYATDNGQLLMSKLTSAFVENFNKYKQIMGIVGIVNSLINKFESQPDSNHFASLKQICEIIYQISFGKQCARENVEKVFYHIDDLITKNFDQSTVNLFKGLISQRKLSKNEKINYSGDIKILISSELTKLEIFAKANKSNHPQSKTIINDEKLFVQFVTRTIK